MNKEQKLENINALIFDLGGVILNIDYSLTIQAFKNLGAKNFDALYSQASQSGIFDAIETGKITEKEFVEYIHTTLQLDCNSSQIIAAWNAMLLNWDSRKLDLVSTLRKNYSVYLLSNTNSIHADSFMRSLYQQVGLTKLDDHFDHVYLSHEIGMRKPNTEIFEYVLQQNNLVASQTLFFDDTMQHIVGAKSVGIQTQLIDSCVDILQFFS